MMRKRLANFVIILEGLSKNMTKEKTKIKELYEEFLEAEGRRKKKEKEEDFFAGLPDMVDKFIKEEKKKVGID